MKAIWKVWVILTIAGIFILMGVVVLAADKPQTVAELAMYKGTDRQHILEEGARKEGKLTFYTSGIVTQAVRPIVQAFERKYPFIKVQIWRGGSRAIMARVTEEHKSGRPLFDILESTQISHMMLQEIGMVQSYYSPNLADIEEEAIIRASDGGALAAPIRASGISLGYNTKMITYQEIPKTYEELLDPKWKGKMTIFGELSGVNWMGTILQKYGEDFVKQLSRQNFDVHMVSGRAILDMVIAGEYPFSPALFDSHVFKSKINGAPVDWIPLEPVMCNLGQIALSKAAPNPHAALLFIDFELTKTGAEIHKAAGYIPFRKDVVPPSKPYQKAYGPKSLAEAKQWSELFDMLFLKR